MIRQVEVGECGLSCLAMILGWFGHHATLGELRQRFTSSYRGCSLSVITRHADAMGITSRAVRLEIHELSKLRAPCILHWNLDHFVVLKHVRGNRIVIHDPSKGIRYLSLDNAASSFTGVALEMSIGPDFKRRPAPPPISLVKLAGTITGFGKAIRTIFGFAIALEAVALLMPQFMQITVDQVLADEDQDLLTIVGISFVLLVAIQSLISALRGWAVVWLGSRFTMNWTGNIFSHLMKLPQLYFLRRSLGDIVSRMGAISTLQKSLTTQLVAALIDGLMAFATLALLFFYSTLMSFIVVAGVILYALLRAAYYRTLLEKNLNQIAMDARQQSCLIEAIRGVQAIRLHNRSSDYSTRFLNHTADALNTQIEVQRLGLLFSTASNLLGGLQRGGLLWLGALLTLRGQFTAGMVIAFTSYGDQFITRANSFADYLVQLKLLRLQGERLADIVTTSPEPNLHGCHIGDRPTASIRFEGVSFRYSESYPWILFNCSFEVSPQQSIAIVGASGSGKTTLIRLILGLLEPQAGRILIGGVDLSHLGKTCYRDMLGTVMQDDRLFSGTIAENICFLDGSSSPSRIEAAARLAQIHDQIVAMPMGYHTYIGDMGSGLSGGQKQRLFLARALYRDPQILVLDEATSHLDLASESRISGILKELRMTRVLVAHRPETVATADRILLLSGQRLHELSQASEGLSGH
ncbi:peptidase domain-containing ABC transporter [Luteibacter yeojuensis]|uniref:Peptidase domain-containing ABC transporter n=2 Tax=Luteibacter yeojuensis TaxID=345309 RepID=A0A7X5TNY3_9GAMM|nr:peptidase domain-containing ABC transporter [Luteibacter yeojuensis]NID14223.1 peptidase domain-containing ABC transporter [Luteibacter yeojuensis]